MKEKKRNFLFFESAVAAWNGKMKFWVFQEGKIFPVACLQEVPGRTIVYTLRRKYDEFSNEIMKNYRMMYGGG